MVPRPKRVRSVDCKWIFNLKYNAYGALERYKAWIVAKGYTQAYGIDYLKIFAPVDRYFSISTKVCLGFVKGNRPDRRQRTWHPCRA